MMKNIKENLVKRDGGLFTCLLVDDWCHKYRSFLKNDQHWILDKYETFIDCHLQGRITLAVDCKGVYLKYDERLLRRYFILDAFEEEMLATKEYKWA